MFLTQESATALTVSLPLLTSYPITRCLRYIHRPETRLLYSRRGARTQRTAEASLCTNIHDTVCTQSSELSVYVLLSLMLLSSWCTPCWVSDSLGDFLSNLGAENERPVRRRVWSSSASTTFKPERITMRILSSRESLHLLLHSLSTSSQKNSPSGKERCL